MRRGSLMWQVAIGALALTGWATAMAQSSSPSVVYRTQPNSEVALGGGNLGIWVDVPGLSATLNLPKGSSAVVAYNVTVQNPSSVQCVVLLRASIAGIPYQETVLQVPAGTTSSGAQTVATTPMSGAISVKIQALLQSDTDCRITATPWGSSGDIWGSTMTAFVLR